MKVPRFENVFFCLPLRCGVILLVYLNLVVAACSVYVFGMLDLLGAIERIFTMSAFEAMHRSFRSKLHPFIILPVILCYALAELCMAVVALVGLHKPKPSLLKIYLEFSMILTIFMIFFRLFDMSNFMWKEEFASALGFMLFKAYYIICVRSLLKKTGIPNDADKVEIDLTERDIEDRNTYSVEFNNEGDEKVLIIDGDNDDAKEASLISNQQNMQELLNV